MITSNTEIRVCDSEAERRDVFRLRYDVFTLEKNDERYADHTTKEFRDSDDCPSALLIGVFLEEDAVERSLAIPKLIGTARLTPGKQHHFIAWEKYDFPTLAEQLELTIEELEESVLRIDRVAIAKPFRGSGLLTMLMQVIDQMAIENGGRILVGATKASDRVEIRVFSLFGWRRYGRPTSYGSSEFQRMFKRLSR